MAPVGFNGRYEFNFHPIDTKIQYHPPSIAPLNLQLARTEYAPPRLMGTLVSRELRLQLYMAAEELHEVIIHPRILVKSMI